MQTLSLTEDFLNTSCEQMQVIVNRLLHLDWVDSSGGSLSVRIPEHPKWFGMTQTHSGFNGWKLNGLVVVDEQLERVEVKGSLPETLHPSAVVHRHIYDEFPAVNAIIHTHAPYSLVFACKNESIKPLTLHSHILGEVPCLDSDVDRLTDRHQTTIAEVEERMTSGMSGYRYALAHFKELLDQISNKLKPREEELGRHGLGFTVYKHGIFVMARNLAEAHDNLTRIERNAQVQLLS